jgi:hypothetical protein
MICMISPLFDGLRYFWTRLYQGGEQELCQTSQAVAGVPYLPSHGEQYRPVVESPETRDLSV